MSAPLPRRFAAELVGTLVFVLVGAGGVVTASGLVGLFIGSSPSGALLVAALANGVGLAVAVTATMGVSGGHLNPAVTLAMLVTRRIRAQEAAAYIVAQVLGAMLAGLVLVGALPRGAGSQAHYGAPSLGVSAARGILLEAVMTFVLVFAVFGTAVDPRAPKIGGFGIGLAVFLDVLFGGNYTGAMMNPARAIGPEVAAHYFYAWYVYWVGPIVGGVVAALIYEHTILGRGAAGQ